MNPSGNPWALLLAFILCLLQPITADARGLPHEIQQLLHPDDALWVADKKGALLFSQNPNIPQIPASTLKIPTALFALETLGSDYRFPTKIGLTQKKSLVLKGYGDPLFISEMIANHASTVATTLKKRKIDKVEDLVMDGSAFAPVSIPGRNPSFQPYDAVNGALCANFNTVNYRKKDDGTLFSAEPQTPLLAYIKKRIPAEAPQGRITLSVEESRLYAGHLFAWFLKKNGIDVKGKVKQGLMPSAKKLIWSQELLSPFTLEQAVKKLMTYSNNFMANQIFLASGAHQMGPPATLTKSRSAFEKWVHSKNITSTPPIAVEGSGLSCKNRITAQTMGAFLSLFHPWKHLLPIQGPAQFKTGTLTGVSARAGYIASPRGEYRFVIILNRPLADATELMQKLTGYLSRP